LKREVVLDESFNGAVELLKWRLFDVGRVKIGSLMMEVNVSFKVGNGVEIVEFVHFALKRFSLFEMKSFPLFPRYES
jgi:hypothetical protein